MWLVTLSWWLVNLLRLIAACNVTWRMKYCWTKLPLLNSVICTLNCFVGTKCHYLVGNRNMWHYDISSNSSLTASAASICVYWRRSCLDVVEPAPLNTAKTEVLWCASSRRQHHTLRARLSMPAWYGSTVLRRVADIDSRLRSASTSAFVTPSSCRTTIRDRAFFVAAPRVWYTLPYSVTASETLSTFKRRLKTHLFVTSSS